jgi:hypothetical protein
MIKASRGVFVLDPRVQAAAEALFAAHDGAKEQPADDDQEAQEDEPVEAER